jgi:drug/metabolite transporter (DMT)-like permease
LRSVLSVLLPFLFALSLCPFSLPFLFAFGLTAGTLLLKAFCADVPLFEATAVQLIGGAVTVLALMLLFETPRWRWTTEFTAALAWNTFAVSILGMAIYNLMLDRYGSGRASAGFFIVPGASALIAYMLLDKRLSAAALLGLAAATLGVALVWWRPSPR